MLWQDFALAAGGWFFTIALIPTIISKSARVPRATSVTTSFFVFVGALAHWSIGYKLTAGTEVLCGLAWAFIAWKRNIQPSFFDWLGKEAAKTRKVWPDGAISYGTVRRPEYDTKPVGYDPNL